MARCSSDNPNFFVRRSSARRKTRDDVLHFFLRYSEICVAVRFQFSGLVSESPICARKASSGAKTAGYGPALMRSFLFWMDFVQCQQTVIAPSSVTDIWHGRSFPTSIAWAPVHNMMYMHGLSLASASSTAVSGLRLRRHWHDQ